MTKTRMSGLVFLPLAVWLPLTGCSTGPESKASEETAGQYTLDPDNYRQDIETVEAVLYQNAQPAASDLERISGAIFQLGSKALAQEEHPLRKEKARLIMTLASRGDLRGMEETPEHDLERLRAEWETLRETAFQGSDWERTPHGQFDHTGMSDEVAAGEIHAFNFVLDRLASLIEHGHWEVIALISDFESSGETPADEEVNLRKWQSWTSDWERRIQAALTGLPARPAQHDASDYWQAHESLDRVVAELLMVTVGAGERIVPESFQWERRFTRAEAALAESREHLARCD